MEITYNQAKKRDQETFIKNMVHLREIKGWTQEEMAIKIHQRMKTKFNRSTYASWEERRAFPPVTMCRIVSEIFHADLTEMLTIRL